MLAWITMLPLVVVLGTADDRDKLEERKQKALYEAGERHLELGLWCRDKNLVPQATSELLLAVEVSQGRHRGANVVLSLMRRYDDAFWKKKRPRPSRSRITSYEIKAKKAQREDQEDRLAVAEFAHERELHAEALAEYEEILRELDAALVFDDRGRIELEFGRVPSEVASKIRERAITINDKLYLRDEFLAHLPELGAIHEVESEALRVRTATSVQEAAELHALGEALLPHLEQALAGRPTRRMNVFVFPERALFETWLDAAGLGSHKVAAGLADRASFTAVVDAGERDADAVQSIFLHELTHLFVFGVTRGVLPSWTSEGLAELWGGQGTFAWDGETLTVGGMLAEHERALLRDPDGLLPLGELVAGDALEALSAEDPRRGPLFYAQSWALVRFLRDHASKDVTERFAGWLDFVTGAALGSSDNLRSRDSKAADTLFDELFGSDLAKIEAQFRAWAATL